MSASAKIGLGIITLLPIICIGLYIIFFIQTFFSIARFSSAHDPSQNLSPDFFFTNFFGIIVFAMLSGLLSLGLMIYYIVHAINNKTIDSNERLIWILIFIFAGMIGFPVYWYMRIWKTKLPVAVQG